MYNIGTVSTTANSPKITGTGTRWKDNSTLVSVGQLVLIENGATLIINCIDSIESNTALTLGFPVPVKLTNVKYRILTTMIDSISDGVNKATAQVIASEIFTDIFTELMTGTGTIEFELPNGQKVKLRTVAEIDKQLDGKVDKKGGTLTGGLVLPSVTVLRDGVNNRLNLYPSTADGDDSLAFFQYNTVGGAWGGRLEIPRVAAGSTAKLLQFGDFGIGKSTGVTLAQNGVVVSDYRINGPAYCYGGATSDSYNKGNHTLFNIFAHSTGNYGAQFGFAIGGKSDFGFRMINNNAVLDWCTIYHTGNTTKDSNGNLKAASPIIKVFSDHIELNEESEGVELEKLETGRYKLKGTLGMHSDASWGGIHGGIVIPDGINRLPLIWGDFEVLEDGDIIIESRFRDHQLPPPLTAKRLETYPEFKGLNDYDLCDIPNGHWVDVRVNMPSNSIYNQKQAEAERLAKIEAERLAQEEAKRVAEEAERAEQEAAEQMEKQ
ncbi:hypothetical protein [Providencia sp. PROV252]|uniref:phage tail fiber protein n=1 Tax=Providencia sp. PROV252 TaxID=2936799 RepID=UPI00298FF487|nr:hypothetical protein [Providencia sp. PROV252]